MSKEELLLAAIMAGGRDVSLTNMVTNGNFANTTGWTSTGASFTAAANVASFLANSPDTLSQLKSLVSGRKYYYCGNIKVTGAGISLRLNDAVNVSSVAHSGSGNYEFISAILSAGNTSASSAFYVYDGRTSGWSTINIKYLTVIDLTTAFGAGNEPTKEQMDWIMSQLANQWLNGTQTVTYYW